MAKRKNVIPNFWPFDAGQLLGSRTYHYKINKKGRSISKSTNTRFKGYTIYKDQNGNYTIPGLTGNDGSYFDDLREAKRFIADSVRNVRNVRKNPEIRKPNMIKIKKVHTLILKNPDKRFFN